jgi:hypothetical protein
VDFTAFVAFQLAAQLRGQFAEFHVSLSSKIRFGSLRNPSSPVAHCTSFLRMPEIGTVEEVARSIVEKSWLKRRSGLPARNSHNTEDSHFR